jgi:uncharacterized membrane protein
MILTFTFVVGFMIVGLSVLILWVEVTTPEADTGIIANTLMSLVSGILGALLGLIAGKSSGDTALNTRPNGTQDTIEIPPQ